MVMGSLFDTPTDEEDQNPPQPQQPPPPDPLAQQPAPSYADMAQGASNIANTFAPPQPPTTGQDFIDAPTGSPRAQLEQERQGQSQYSSAGQALATALPMVAFGAPAAAAGLGIQAATQAAGLPQPIQDAASLLPFTEGGLVQRGLQAGLGGLGAYGGQQADQALNLPQIPGLGGPGALLGGIGGFGAAGALERGVGGLARNADPLAGIQPISPPAATGIGSLLDTPKNTEIVKFDQTPTTTTTAPTSTTTTSGGMSPEEEKAYRAGYDLASVPGSNYGRPQYGWPNVGNGAEDNPLSNAHWAGVAQAQAEKMAAANGPPTPGGFRSPEQGLIAEGADGTIHNITGFLGARGDGEQFFQTEDGVVPLSQLTNLSAADRAELGQMRTAAGGMPPNTPNAQPITGQPSSPGAQGFQQSPAGQQFAGQGAAGMNVTQPGVSTSNAAPSTTYGGGAGGITGQAPPAGRPSSGGGGRGGPPPTLAGKIDWDPFHNLMSAIGASTQPLLTGLHLARFAPQEALRPSVLGNGLRAMGEAALKGNADAVSAHINNDFGPNVPAGVRPEAMKQWSGNPSTNPTAVQKFINSLPVVGPVLNRFREVNSALLGNLRDAHYLTAADRLARTDPNASLDMYNDLWREANNATGHSTIPGLSGNSVIGNMGLGPSAMAARVQELGNTVIGSGAPVPFAAAGSRAEAFKTLMGVAGTMAGTTALASALGANVNTTNPFTAFGVDSTFLKPVTTNGVFKTAYGTGGAGYDTVIKAAANIGNDLFNGDEKAALNHALAFSRGEFGVVPSGVIDSILGTTWDGKPYSWNDFLNEAKTGFMADQNGNLGQGRSVPIPAQDMGEAVKAYGPEGLLRAAPSLLASSVQTSPINTTSQAFKYATTPDTLTRAFQGEDKPLATILQGKDWNDLMSTEKSALTKTLDPQVLQQIHDESYQRNPETTKHSDTVQYIADKKNAVENEILDRYNRGELDGPHAANLMKAAQRDYYSIKDKLDSDPAYQAEQKKFASNPQSGAQVALDGYYQIQDKQARQDYLAHIMQADPELGSRLMIATQPHNQSKLEEMYYAGQLK